MRACCKGEAGRDNPPAIGIGLENLPAFAAKGSIPWTCSSPSGKTWSEPARAVRHGEQLAQGRFVLHALLSKDWDACSLCTWDGIPRERCLSHLHVVHAQAVDFVYPAGIDRMA